MVFPLFVGEILFCRCTQACFEPENATFFPLVVVTKVDGIPELVSQDTPHAARLATNHMSFVTWWAAATKEAIRAGAENNNLTTPHRQERKISSMDDGKTTCHTSYSAWPTKDQSKSVLFFVSKSIIPL
jgi:hypothetical protein